MAAKSLPAEPISTPNITPLIDVLLVLLIMMILTIPAMTHSVKVDLPQVGPPTGEIPLQHKLNIAASGALTLDGVAIDEASLPDRLVPIVADEKSVVVLNTDEAATYSVFERVLATIKRGGVTRLGFTGHDRFANAF